MEFELYPKVAHLLTSSEFARVYVLLRRVRPVILHSLSHRDNRQQLLPRHVADFVTATTGLEAEVISQCWPILRDTITSPKEDEDYQKYADEMFRQHGPRFGHGAESFYPPHSHCPRDECRDATLVDPITIQCRFFTLRRGVLPATSTSLYCKTCNTRYHPNWQVKDAKLRNRSPLRQYYGGVPENIHVRETVYVERSLCIYIENQMALAQVSATNIALVYNYTIAPAASRNRIHSHLKDDLSYKDVLDAFFLHGLLRDHKLQNTRLFLPHDGHQKVRFDQALRARNLRIRFNGQDMWNHACDDCAKILQREDGSKVIITAGVTDGVTVGHPCCSVDHCQNQLANVRDRFCPEHSDRRHECAVEGCKGQATQRHVTCTDPTHRAWEKGKRKGRSRGNAFRLLSKRLRDAGEGHYSGTTSRAAASDSDLDSSSSDDIDNTPRSNTPIPVPATPLERPFALSAVSESKSPTEREPKVSTSTTGDHGVAAPPIQDPRLERPFVPSAVSESKSSTEREPKASTSTGDNGVAAPPIQDPRLERPFVPSAVSESKSSTEREPKASTSTDDNGIAAPLIQDPSQPFFIEPIPMANVEKYKGHVYRRWTHNEQLYVCCCGIIKSRATFFGGEGVHGVIVWLKRVFNTKRYPGCLPNYIFYDNNCNLLSSLHKAKDHYFDTVGLPVDVFHALHKHGEEDLYCQRHCNPASYPDLVTETGEWLFNSSVAEQVNKWFGAFQRIVREMTTERYHFYLDEVIAIRNRVVVEELYRQGKHPHRIPASVLARKPVPSSSPV